MKAQLRILLATTAAVLVASCSTPAPRPATPRHAPPAPSTSKPEPVTPAPAIQPHPPATPPVPAGPVDTFASLRRQFAMPSCPAPAVRRARLETRNRHGFEARMHEVLPVIDYIQRLTEASHVAGEFALLPWVESHYRNIPPRRGRPAGMWQIMPVTARALKLPVSRAYDGRLDRVASSEAALHLMARYHARWHDWRVADMAYNTGEYRMRRIIKAHGMPASSPAIPDLPVGRTTRQHLTRLLAIACIIRDPARFNVKLPLLEPERRLETVELEAPARVDQVARLSGISTSRFRKLNPGYRLSTIPATAPKHVLLPADAARSLTLAMANGELESGGELAGIEGAAASYTVTAGDSLWSIARRFDVRVEELRVWNNLADSTLQPGQVLTLEPMPSS